jgi:hypothetical protein
MSDPDHCQGQFFRQTASVEAKEFVVKRKRFSVEQIVAAF